MFAAGEIAIKRQLNSKSSLRLASFVLMILAACNSATAQTADAELRAGGERAFENNSAPLPVPSFETPETLFVKADKSCASAAVNNRGAAAPTFAPPLAASFEPRAATDSDAANESNAEQLSDRSTRAAAPERFHWKPALIQSGVMLGVQHAFRITQKRTTREFGGEFFADWAQTVKNLHGWHDGDSKFTNYVAHPLQGATTGRIFINNSDRAGKQEFGGSKKYWETRFKALVWSAAWSAQFELGPISEASLGNVGLRKSDRHKMAWTDLVTTPIAGTAVVVGEDAIDKFVLKNWLERRAGNRATVKIKMLRSLLTPTTTVGNLLRFKAPWHRDNRFN